MTTKVKLIADGAITPDQITLTTASAGTNTTAPATTAFVQQEITALVDSSPAALDTLNELAAALGDDANFSTTVTNSIATKLPLAGGTLTGAVVLGTASAQGNQTSPALRFGPSTYRLGMYTTSEGAFIENKNGDDGINFLVKTAGQAMRIDGGTGNVGIGTTTTFSNPLTLNKAAGAANSLNNQIALTHTGASTAYHIKTIRAAATDEPAGLAFVENTTERLRIDSSGNVGIGATTVDAKLHIEVSSGDANLKLEDGSATYMLLDQNSIGGSDVIRFKTGSSLDERMRIDSSGNTIVESLYVTNDSHTTLSNATKTVITQDNLEMYYQTSQRIIMGRDQYSSGHAGIVFQDPGYSTASGGVVVGSLARGTMGFGTSDNSSMKTRMRINNVGGIIVGEHSSSGAIQPSGLNSGSYQGITFNSPNVVNPRHNYAWSNGLYWWNGSNEGSLSAAGAWTNGSDIAFKKNVQDIEYGLSTVLDLQPRKYQMKLDDIDDIGFIAQEIETIIPEIVHTNENSGYKSLDYGAITAVLVKAIQEQQTIIDDLKTRIETLEG